MHSDYNTREMKVLGVTGTIGSGKSTVCRILSELGCPVIDADRAAHESYKRGTRAYREIVAAFGAGILDATGRIDRASLGTVVFSAPEARHTLNTIVHPATRRLIERRVARFAAAGHAWAAVEATLLIEAGWRELVDRLWVVAAPDDRVIDRLHRDRGQDERHVRSRLGAQMPAHQMMELADDIIYNDGDMEALRARVRTLWDSLPDTAQVSA